MKTKTATGIVVAHDHAVVVLDNCEVDAAGTAVNGLQAVAVLLIGRPDTTLFPVRPPATAWKSKRASLNKLWN